MPAPPPEPLVCPPSYLVGSCTLPAPWTLLWLLYYNCLHLDEPQDKVKSLCFGCLHQLCRQSQETVINTAGKLLYTGNFAKSLRRDLFVTVGPFYSSHFSRRLDERPNDRAIGVLRSFKCVTYLLPQLYILYNMRRMYDRLLSFGFILI